MAGSGQEPEPEVSWSEDGERQIVSIRGDAIDQASFDALAGAVAGRLAGQ